MLPAAPGLFSTTTACLRLSPMVFATKRATTSMPPPAAPGTSNRIGRSGYSPAVAAVAENIRVDATQPRIATLRKLAMCFMVVLELFLGCPRQLTPLVLNFGRSEPCFGARLRHRTAVQQAFLKLGHCLRQIEDRQAVRRRDGLHTEFVAQPLQPIDVEVHVGELGPEQR